MSILINFLLGIFVLDALLLILLVLMQRPKSEGLGAAFGGGMTENIFGAQTTNVLATFTRYLGGLFFGLALLLSILYAKNSQQRSAIQAEAVKTAKPLASPAPASSPAVLTTAPVAAPSLQPQPSVAPKTDTSAAPKVDTGAVPKTDMSAAPTADTSAVPKVDSSAAPAPMASPAPQGSAQ